MLPFWPPAFLSLKGYLSALRRMQIVALQCNLPCLQGSRPIFLAKEWKATIKGGVSEKKLGYQLLHYSGHSFKIGTVTTVDAVGIDKVDRLANICQGHACPPPPFYVYSHLFYLHPKDFFKSSP